MKRQVDQRQMNTTALTELCRALTRPPRDIVTENLQRQIAVVDQQLRDTHIELQEIENEEAFLYGKPLPHPELVNKPKPPTVQLLLKNLATERERQAMEEQKVAVMMAQQAQITLLTQAYKQRKNEVQQQQRKPQSPLYSNERTHKDYKRVHNNTRDNNDYNNRNRTSYRNTPIHVNTRK